MSTLNKTIETAYGKASTCTQPESQRWLELAMMAASRGGGEGIAIFLRCVLTLGLPEELAQARDTCVLRLIKRHGRYFIAASLKVRKDLRPALHAYIQKLQAKVKKGADEKGS